MTTHSFQSRNDAAESILNLKVLFKKGSINLLSVPIQCKHSNSHTSTYSCMSWCLTPGLQPVQVAEDQ